MNVLLLCHSDDIEVLIKILSAHTSVYACQGANSPQAALKILVSKEFVPDVIVLPLGCGITTGTEFMDGIRKIEHLSNVQGILIDNKSVSLDERHNAIARDYGVVEVDEDFEEELIDALEKLKGEISLDTRPTQQM